MFPSMDGAEENETLYVVVKLVNRRAGVSDF